MALEQRHAIDFAPPPLLGTSREITSPTFEIDNLAQGHGRLARDSHTSSTSASCTCCDICETQTLVQFGPVGLQGTGELGRRIGSIIL